MSIALKYAIFALLATMVNIASQDLALALYGGRHALVCSVLAGTATGLLVKYYLDKKYIFRFVPASIAHDGQTFILYTMMGLLTTAVFWGFEFGFEWVFRDKSMRYLGAVIGLAIGYLLKYWLDQRFVFRPAEET
jgi:putative flippase GtrA